MALLKFDDSEDSGELPQLRYPANEKLEYEQKGPTTSMALVAPMGIVPLQSTIHFFKDANPPCEPTQSTRDLGYFAGI